MTPICLYCGKHMKLYDECTKTIFTCNCTNHIFQCVTLYDRIYRLSYSPNNYSELITTEVFPTGKSWIILNKIFYIENYYLLNHTYQECLNLFNSIKLFQ